MRGRRLLAVVLAAAAVWLALPLDAAAQGWYGYGVGPGYLGYGPPPASFGGGNPAWQTGIFGTFKYRAGMYAGLFTGPIPVDGPDGLYHPGYYRGFRGYYQPPWDFVPGQTGVYNRPEFRAIAAGYGPSQTPTFGGYIDRPPKTTGAPRRSACACLPTPSCGSRGRRRAKPARHGASSPRRCAREKTTPTTFAPAGWSRAAK